MGLSRGGLFGFAFLFAVAAPPTMALADPAQDCANKSGEEAIRACTEAIQGSPQDSKNYINRGFEYDNKGDYDRAIVDFTEAITAQLQRLCHTTEAPFTSIESIFPPMHLARVTVRHHHFGH